MGGKTRSFPSRGRRGFAEIDWVSCPNRELRQRGHRFDEARAAMRDFGLDDLHDLFGSVRAIAELQQALPSEYRTAR